MSQVDDDIVSNLSDNPRFSDILQAALSRRAILIGGVAAAAATFLGGRDLATAEVAALPRGGRQPLLGFTGVATSTADTVVVPPGYTARVLISWGDPLSNGPAFRPDAGNTVADQERQWGCTTTACVSYRSRGVTVVAAMPGAVLAGHRSGAIICRSAA